MLIEYNQTALCFNSLNSKLNPICHLLALLGVHPILHISRIRVNPGKWSYIVLCNFCSKYTIYKYGCGPHNTTWWAANWRPMLYSLYLFICGPGSSVGIATDYGLDGPGIESRWGRDFPPVQTGPGPHPASCTMGTGSFPRVKCGRGVLLTPHPLLASRSWKSRAIPLPPSGPQPGL